MTKNEVVPVNGSHELTPATGTSSGPHQVVKKKTPHEQRAHIVGLQRRFSTLQFIYGIFGIVMMVIQLEFIWAKNTEMLPNPCPYVKLGDKTCFNCTVENVQFPIDPDNMLLTAIRVVISATTVLMLYYQYHYFIAECEFMKIRNMLPPQASRLSLIFKFPFISEACIYIIHPFPGIEHIDTGWPNLVVLSSMMMFTRVVLIGRVVKYRSALNTSNGWFIGSLTNVEFTAAFFLKTALKNYPLRCMASCLVLLLVIAGYSLYIIERFYCAFDDDSCCQPISLGDAEWMLVITILTIGYGDVVPGTHGGRFVAIVGGLMGTLITAVTIALTTSYLNLTRSEHKVNSFLQKDANRRLINDHAARAIQIFIQVVAAKKKLQKTGDVNNAKRQAEKLELKMYECLRVYRKMKRYVHTRDGSDPVDKQMTMLETMEINVEDIKSKVEALLNSSYPDDESTGDEYEPPMDESAPDFAKIEEKSHPPRETKIESNFNSVPTLPPPWATRLDESMSIIITQLNTLGGELELVKSRVNDHIENSNARIASIERDLEKKEENIIDDALSLVSQPQ